jgi:uncharacterized protein
MMRRKDREITDRAEIESIINACDVCRIAFSDNNIPYLVTLNFGYSSGEKPCFYFHCASQGRKLDMMRKNNNVFFGLDTGHELYGGEEPCDWGMRFSSVTGTGILTEITDQTEKKKGLDLLMSHYGAGNQLEYNEREFSRTTILKLEVSSMTGKRKQ